MCAKINFGENFLHNFREELFMFQYSIGIDIGTTNTKAILFDQHGTALQKSAVEYSILLPKPSFREMSPDTIMQAVIHVLREVSENVDKNRISFVSFSSMMHSLIAMDKNGKPLTNCIIWADSRSKIYTDQFKKNGLGLKIYNRTGAPCHPMLPLYKIMWLRDHEPEIFCKAAKFVSIKEYVFFHLFGEYVVDYSIASATGMFNLFTKTWDAEILSIIGIDEARLSRVVPTKTCFHAIKKGLREKIGLASNTEYIIGASDGCLANLGAGAIKKGTLAVTIGTSGAVRACFDKPVIDVKGRVFCYILTEGKYIVGGPINNGGIAYRWFRDTFCMPEKEKAEADGLSSYTYIDRYVKQTPAGSHNLLFLPFLMGERAPYWNSNLKSAFVGITDSHTKQDFARATIEGICYSLNSVYQIVQNLTGQIDTVFADGGLTKSKECNQILSDVLNTDINVFEHTECSCLGAFLLGMNAMEKLPDLERGADLISQRSVYHPRPENRKMYSHMFSAYIQATNALMPVFEFLSDF